MLRNALCFYSLSQSLAVPKSFRTGNAVAKSQTLWLLQLSVFTYRLIKNGFAGLKRFRDFRETGRPLVMWKIFGILLTHLFVIIFYFETGLIRIKMSHKIFHVWFSFSFSLIRRTSPRRLGPGQRLPKHRYSCCAWEPGPHSIHGTALLNFY